MSKYRVGFVYPWGNLDTVPSICNAIEMFAEAGYDVEIYTVTADEFPLPTFSNNRITIFPSLIPRWERRGIHRVLPASWSTPLQIWQNHQKKPYLCFIGVDARGLMKASRMIGFIRTRLVYYSLELLFHKEVLGTKYSNIKAQELVLSQRAQLIIIQDQQRARLLAAENQLSLDRFSFVPNAPRGKAIKQSSNYWHQKFNLSTEKRIVLHTGSVSEWTGIAGIIASVPEWPENWVLIIHTRHDTSASDGIVALKANASPERVYFSTEPVSRLNYDTLVASADIGIAFYLETPNNVYTQQNISTIGLSSGKVSYSLRFGLPVIMNDVRGIAELIHQHHAGVIVRVFSDIAAAIRLISTDYDTYSKSALRVFDEYLSFEKAFQEVIRRISA